MEVEEDMWQEVEEGEHGEEVEGGVEQLALDHAGHAAQSGLGSLYLGSAEATIKVISRQARFTHRQRMALRVEVEEAVVVEERGLEEPLGEQ